MRNRNLFAFKLMAFLLAIGVLNICTTSTTASAGSSLRKHGKTINSKVVGIKRLRRGQRVLVPIAPSVAYDYPYYYRRGFYPTHIGPGYIYINYFVTNKRRNDYIGRARVPLSANERCARRFRSFERNTGYYTTYGGKKRLCPYLR